MSKVPLKDLQSFVTASRARNFSRAAEQLHVTVSALSHQMRGLEERLGQILFLRGPRGIALTADGERLYDAVAPHFDAIENALRCCRTSREDAIAVSVLPSVASSWLVPRLPAFVARHPEIELSLQSNVALVDFAKEPVDAALRYGPGHWSGVTAEHLFDEWITPVASPALIARIGRPALEDLGRHPLLGDPGNRWVAWFDTVGGSPPRRYVAHFDDSETLQKAAVEGLGIALGRMTMARPLIEAGRLVPLTDVRLRAEFAHYLVYPPRSERHAGLRAFRTWLLEEAAGYAARTAQPTPAAPPMRRPKPVRAAR